MNPLDLEKN